MAFNDEYFSVWENNIPWGTTLEEAALLLKDQEPVASMDFEQSNLQIRASMFTLGLHLWTYTLIAPFPDRPVMCVVYELAPYDSGTPDQPERPYLERLSRRIGKPDSEWKYAASDPPKEPYITVYSARWLIGECAVTLLIFGANRTNNGVPVRGELRIYWLNEIKAASRFREKDLQQKEKIVRLLGSNSEAKRFNMNLTQSPLQRSNFHLGAQEPVVDKELHRARLRLYYEDIIPTPEIISEKLEEDQILFSPLAALNQCMVSNKWDTVILSPFRKNFLEFIDTLPAKGSGGYDLRLNHFVVDERDRGNRAILELKKEIENALGGEIPTQQFYDT